MCVRRTQINWPVVNQLQRALSGTDKGAGSADIVTGRLAQTKRHKGNAVLLLVLL